MKAKTYGKAVYIIKSWYKDAQGNLAVKYETWHIKARAKKAYERRIQEYGEGNVYAYKANQCSFE